MGRLAILIVLITSSAHAYQPRQPAGFGAYSKAYTERAQARRWKDLCKGGGRYQAMSEAYEAGKSDPCR